MFNCKASCACGAEDIAPYDWGDDAVKAHYGLAEIGWRKVNDGTTFKVSEASTPSPINEHGSMVCPECLRKYNLPPAVFVTFSMPWACK